MADAPERECSMDMFTTVAVLLVAIVAAAASSHVMKPEN
jgi:hypothetical protein